MRVLHLQLDDGPVSLHPFVTVVRGCSPVARQELIDVFSSIPRGRATARGLLEAHGVLLDLTDDALAMLDLDTELDVVVRASDRPAPGPARSAALDEAEQRVAEARTELRAVEAVLVAAAAARDDALAGVEAAAAIDDVEVEGHPGVGAAETADGELAAAPAPAADQVARVEADAAFAAARERYDVAKAASVAAEDRAAVAAARHRDAMATLRAAEDALETTSELRDPAAPAVLDAARRRLADAEAARAAAPVAATTAAASEDTVDHLREERMAMEAALLAIETTDPLPVRLALEELRTGRRESLVPSPAAIELAERLAIAEDDLRLLEARRQPDGSEADDVAGRRAAAESAVADAEAAVARAESALHGTILDPEDVAELERIHDELLQVRDQADKRFGGARAAQRLAEVAAEEEAILDRLGYLTWADYRLGAPSAVVATRDQLADALVAAQARLRAASDDLHAIETVVDTELAQAEAVERRRRLQAQAVELLGGDPGDDIEGALRRLRVPEEDTGSHLHRLQEALDGAGVELADDEVDEELLTALAEGWLHEQVAAEAHRVELQEALRAVDARLSAVQASARVVEGDPDAAANALVEEARAAVAVAEARVAADAAATAQLDDLRRAFEQATVEERDSAAAMVEADEGVLTTEQALRLAEGTLREADLALSRLEVTHRAAMVAAADRADFQARVAAASGDLPALESALDQAWDTVERAREAHIEAGRALGVAMAEVARLQRAAAPAGAADEPTGAGGESAERTTDAGDASSALGADDLEWYLLARLAAQRSVSYAGSVPLVLDDALAGLDATELAAVLDRLERMASTVQLVILTEELAAVSWAEAAGAGRALVVEC